MDKPKSVDDFIEKYPKWKTELDYLRELVLDTNMEESIKWQFPTYTLNGQNVVSIFASKKYAGLWFFQGVFLEDQAKKLFNAQEGKTKALRQWRLHNIHEIQPDTDLIRAYIYEAMENSLEGKKIKPVRNTKPVIIDAALVQFFKQNPLIKKVFDTFSLSKRREYADYISSAKREATKQSRLKKIEPMISSGKGLHDAYKKKK